MASLTSAKHIIGEIDGTRCTIVESNVTKARMEFLRDLLAHNGLEVKVREEAKGDEAKAEEASEPLYTVGVTDIIFNPVYAIYERTLLRPDGTIVLRQGTGSSEVIPVCPTIPNGKTDGCRSVTNRRISRNHWQKGLLFQDKTILPGASGWRGL
jgi:hypothetical protein